MIPLRAWADRLSPEWLRDAEVSEEEGTGRAGLSLFLPLTADFPAFTAATGLPTEMVEREHAFRRAFDLAPRRWFKAGFREGVPGAWSQYLVVAPTLPAPATTLRLMARALGDPDPGRIAPAFARAFETPGALFAAIAKGDRPRLSTRVLRTLLPDVLDDFAEVGYVSRFVRRRLLDAQAPIPAGAHVYLSVDPATPDAVALDLEHPRLGETPEPRYLKLRPAPDGFRRTRYRPLAP